ncbi:hypothetical protein Tco_0040674 [Tanacetum coccineum]
MFHGGNIKTWLQTVVNALQSCQDDDLAMPGLEGEVKQYVFKRVQDLITATQLAVWTIEVPSRGSSDQFEYITKGQNEAKKDKTKHETGKSMRKQSRRRIHF